MLPQSKERVQIETFPVTPDELEAGLKVVNAFLKDLSRGDVNAGWNSVSDETKAAISHDAWKEMLSVLYSEAGDRRAGNFDHAVKVKSLPGGFSGDIMVVVVAADYSRENIAETISLIRKDGRWKLASFNYKLAGY